MRTCLIFLGANHHAMRLSETDIERAHRLWDELADFPASQTDGALLHLMKTMQGWLDTDNVIWVGAARLAQGKAAKLDSLSGWRGLSVRHLVLDPVQAEISRRAAAEQDTDPGMTTRALADGTGKFRIHRLHDGFIDLKAFKRSGHYYAQYEVTGIRDRMFVGIPVNEDAESFFLFDRMRQTPRFTIRDTEIVAYAMRGLKWFQRDLLLSHGLLLATAPVTATERRILHFLLTDRTESEIARELGQAPKTTHKYITEILRKFGVRGRTGLLVLWLGEKPRTNVAKNELIEQ